MTEWGDYLARGLQQHTHTYTHIYHMALRADFDGTSEYFPPTYEQDGFIHATAEPKFLLHVGNTFYQRVPGDWVCLKLDTRKLTAPLVYEPAMPVGDVPSAPLVKEGVSECECKDEDDPLFPHIYGGINAHSVVEVLRIVRSEDGTFRSIDSLVDAMGAVTLTL